MMNKNILSKYFKRRSSDKIENEIITYKNHDFNIIKNIDKNSFSVELNGFKVLNNLELSPNYMDIVFKELNSMVYFRANTNELLKFIGDNYKELSKTVIHKELEYASYDNKLVDAKIIDKEINIYVYRKYDNILYEIMFKIGKYNIYFRPIHKTLSLVYDNVTIFQTNIIYNENLQLVTYKLEGIYEDKLFEKIDYCFSVMESVYCDYLNNKKVHDDYLKSELEYQRNKLNKIINEINEDYVKKTF